MQKIFSVAIDGPAGAGKSTIAKALAQETGALYLDTGAMYRAVGLWMRQNGIDPRDEQAVGSRVGEVGIDVRHEAGVQRVYLDGTDVSEEIRLPENSQAASQVSAHAAVRERMVAMQRDIARGRCVVMDGRDIGTRVLPDATLKIFLTASSEVRAARRVEQIRRGGGEADPAQILQAIRQRDWDDSHRVNSPLVQAADAVLIDSSNMDAAAVTARIRALLTEAIGA